MSVTKNNTVIRLSCAYCQDMIKNEQLSVSCKMCHEHFHKTCSKQFLKQYRNFAYCKECLNNFDLIKYDPYYETLAEISNKNEIKSFANDEPPESLEILEEYSNILENCKNLAISQYNKAVSEKKLNNGNPLTLQFLTIDGNASNFDSLATTIAKFKNEFCISGLAVTNKQASNDKLYKLDGYNSLYMDKLCDKKKGSGVAIYFQKSMITERIDKLSFINKDIKILFAKLSLNENNIFVGIVYRPPNGDVQKFYNHFSETMSKFNKSDKICIMDDFNINLFENSSNTRKVEENFMCTGLQPTISVTTHHKPNCNKSCIDNIFLKNLDTENMCTGTITTHISHHRSLFAIIDVKNKPKDSIIATPKKITHNYNDKNIGSLNELLKHELN